MRDSGVCLLTHAFRLGVWSVGDRGIDCDGYGESRWGLRVLYGTSGRRHSGTEKKHVWPP